MEQELRKEIVKGEGRWRERGMEPAMRFSSRLAGWNLAVGFCGRKICLTDIQGVES